MMSPVRRSIMWGNTSCTFFITTLTFQVQHAVDGPDVGIHQVAAHVAAGIRVQDVELARRFQNPRKQSGAILRVEQVDDQWYYRIAVLVAKRPECCLVAVDRYDARTCSQHGLGAGQSDS